MISIKSFLILLVLFIIVLLGIGMIEIRKADYICYPADTVGLRFADKVEIVQFGSFHFNAYPVSYDCDEPFQHSEDEYELLRGFPLTQ